MRNSELQGKQANIKRNLEFKNVSLLTNNEIINLDNKFQ